jgi:hypothetical protein
MKSRWGGMVLFLGGLLLSPPGWADAIPSRSSACPPGAIGTSSHDGDRCVLRHCETDEDCDGSWREISTCRQWRACSFTREVEFNPVWLYPGDPERGTLVEETSLVGSCDPADACTGLEDPPPASVQLRGDELIECEELMLCVPRSLPALPRIGPVELSEDPPSKTPIAADDSSSKDARSCSCSAGLTQALPLTLAGLIGGMSLLRRKEP